MADLNEIQASGSTKIVGSDATGNENTPINATTAGGLHSNLRDNAGTEVGTRANLLQVQSPNLISTLNTTSTNLGSNAIFTGLAEEVLDYACIAIQVFTNQASAANGLSLQQSPDGSNWDDADTYTLNAMTALGGKIFVVPVGARFFRIVYTNGSIAQTAFRLQVIFHKNVITHSSHRIEDTLDGQNDAELVISILKARRIDGNYDNIKQSNNNELQSADILDNGGVSGVITIGTTPIAIKVGAANLLNRKRLTFINVGTTTLYWGYSNTITGPTNAAPIFKNQPVSDCWGPNTTIWVVAVSSGSLWVGENA